MANKVARIRDSGVPLVVTVKEGGVAVDISAATSTEIHLRRPNGSTKRFAAAFVTDGSDGQVTYTTDATTLDQVGNWEVRARVTTPSYDVRSEADILEVQAAAE